MLCFVMRHSAHILLKMGASSVTSLFCMQGFYQEAGRAGRDGKPSDCILYYSAGDMPRIIQLLRGGARGRSKRGHFQKGMDLLNQVCLLIGLG